MSKLIVCMGTLLAGGAERVLCSLSTAFADAYDEVEYVMWLPSGVFYDLDPRVKVTSIVEESGSKKRLLQAWWFRRKIKRERPTMILSFMVMCNFIVTLSVLGLKCRVVVSERNDPRFFKRGKRLRNFIYWLYARKNVKGVVMQTIPNKELLPPYLHHKAAVIYNPVNIPEDTIGKGLRSQKKDLVVSVGRLERQKCQDILIRSFAKFHEKNPTYHLVIYGDGSKRTQLQSLVQELGMEEHISLPGRIKNVPDAIKEAKMFVLTSLYEGMSNALLEAMAIGIPCISTKVSGSTDLIDDHKNGLLVDVGDGDGIANAMDYIANHPEEANKFAVMANKVIDNLNLSKISQTWIDYLKACQND